MMIKYKGTLYVEAAQKNPHRPMTSTERTRMRQTLKNRRPTKKVLQSFSAPTWRTIRGKNHKGCWEVTFTYKLMGGASNGKSSNFTRCVGFDKSKKPQLKKSPQKKSGYEVVKKEAAISDEENSKGYWTVLVKKGHDTSSLHKHFGKEFLGCVGYMKEYDKCTIYFEGTKEELVDKVKPLLGTGFIKVYEGT